MSSCSLLMFYLYREKKSFPSPVTMRFQRHYSIHRLCVLKSYFKLTSKLLTMILFVADFENSSMKNSFSMSSLQPSSRNCLEQSSQATNSTPSPVLPNRAYNSLNHKLKLVSTVYLLIYNRNRKIHE